MDVFTLAAKLSLDSKGFAKDLQKQESGFKKFGDKLEAGFGKIQKAAKVLLSGVVVKKAADAVSALVSETASMGDKIDKQSQALGLSRKAYQEWDYILSQSGASIDSMGVSMKTLNNAILSGGKETSNALKDIGLSAEGLKDLSQEQAFEKVVRAFQQLPAGAEKSALAVKLFGRNGQDLLPLLNSDIYSIDMLRLKARDLGLIMSDEAVNASVKYTDSLDTLQRTFNGLKYSIGSKVLPMLTRGFENLTKYASKIRRAYESNGLSGVFRTLVNDIKNINWPTWGDVEKAATDAWNGIKEGVANLGGLIFGKNEKGEVNWPSFVEAVEWARVNIWEGVIKKGVKEFAGLIFGKDEEGEVNWPTFSEAIEWARVNIWEGVIKKGVSEYGGMIFGKDENGEVNWPKNFDEAVEWARENIWDKKIKKAAEEFGGIVFGKTEDGKVNWPSLDKVRESAQKFWHGEDGNGGVMGAISDIFNAVFGLKNPDAEGQASAIGRWWEEEVKPLLGTLLDYTLAVFGLPSAKDMADSINAWLDQVVADIHDAPLKLLDGIFGTNLAEQAEEQRKLQEAILGTDESGMTWAEKHQIHAQTAEQMREFEEEYQRYKENIEANGFQIPLGYDEWLEQIKGLQDQINSVSEKRYPLNFDATVNWPLPLVENNNPGVSQYRPKAIGAWDIPYDNYPILAHRNEILMNATQARQYREGGAGASGLLAAIQGMRNDLKNLTIQVDGKDFGRAVVAYGSQGVKNYIGGTNRKAQAGYGT